MFNSTYVFNMALNKEILNNTNSFSMLESSGDDEDSIKEKPLEEKEITGEVSDWDGDTEDWENTPSGPGKYRQELKTKPQEDPEVNYKDIEQPFLNIPVNGIFNQDTFNQVLDVLVLDVTQEELQESAQEKKKQIFDYMCKQKFAPIRRKDKVMHDFTARTCKRKTFGRKIVSALSDILIPQISKKLHKADKVPIDIKMHPTHGDILFYTKGGFFNQHRDSAIEHKFETPAGHVWHCYSFLMGIDTNIQKHVEDGNTNVYLLPVETINRRFTNNFTDKNLIGRNLFKHSFPQSRISSNWVMFNAEAVHASIPIKQVNKFKLALKLDVWCLEKCQDSIILETEQYQCGCILCKPHETEHKTLHPLILQKYDCCPDVMKKILNMIKDEPRRMCLFENENENYESKLECSCHDCIEIYLNDISDYDDDDRYYYDYDNDNRYYYDEDDDDCNGYCESSGHSSDF